MEWNGMECVTGLHQIDVDEGGERTGVSRPVSPDRGWAERGTTSRRHRDAVCRAARRDRPPLSFDTTKKRGGKRPPPARAGSRCRGAHGRARRRAGGARRRARRDLRRARGRRRLRRAGARRRASATRRAEEGGYASAERVECAVVTQALRLRQRPCRAAAAPPSPSSSLARSLARSLAPRRRGRIREALGRSVPVHRGVRLRQWLADALLLWAAQSVLRARLTATPDARAARAGYSLVVLRICVRLTPPPHIAHLVPGPSDLVLRIYLAYISDRAIWSKDRRGNGVFWGGSIQFKSAVCSRGPNTPPLTRRTRAPIVPPGARCSLRTACNEL